MDIFSFQNGHINFKYKVVTQKVHFFNIIYNGNILIVYPKSSGSSVGMDSAGLFLPLETIGVSSEIVGKCLNVS